MRDHDVQKEQAFFQLFQEYYDLEKNVAQQHNPENYTLDRMYPLAAAVGNPEKQLKFIHVAGTKGKGSTCYYLAELLKSAGKRCGCFTSPHLDTVRERFQIDGQLLDYEALTHTAVKVVDALHAANLQPSLFELFTVLALRIFADQGVEYVVLETGIGGRLDATNYVPEKLAAVITPVSFDHTSLLGNTIAEIATEKAGILRPNTPVVLARQPFDDAAAVVTARAAELQAPLFSPDDFTAAQVDRWLPAETPAYLRENFTTALKVMAILGLQPDPAAFQPPTLRARFELRRTNPPVIIDAAHNGDSAARLAQAIAQRFPGVNFTVVLGSVPGKDIPGIVQGLASMDADFILTNPDTPRGSALAELEQQAAAAGLKIRSVIPKLTAEDLPRDRPLLFTGSFFTALIAEKLL